jgi:hypothetical protein
MFAALFDKSSVVRVRYSRETPQGTNMTTNLSSEHLAASLQNVEGYTLDPAAEWPATEASLLAELGANAEAFWAELNQFLDLSRTGHAESAAQALEDIKVSLHTINGCVGRLTAV